MAQPTNATPLVDLHPNLHNFHVNVKMFGAVGDGVTDDTTAISSAITAALTNGDQVFFPPGVYPISSALVFDAPTSPRSISLIGAGAGSTQLKWTGGTAASSAMVNITAPTAARANIGGRIEGIEFNGQGDIQDCLRLTDLARTDVVACMFSGATRAGIRGAAGSVGSGTILCNIVRCHFGRLESNVYGVDLSSCHHIVIESCEFVYETTASIQISGGNGNRIISNDFEGVNLNDGAHSIIVNTARITIAFNRFEDVPPANTNSRSILFKTGMTNISVIGNDFGELGAAVYTMEVESGCSSISCIGNQWATAPSSGAINMGGFSNLTSIFAIGEQNGPSTYFANDTFALGFEVFNNQSSARGFGRRTVLNGGGSGAAASVATLEVRGDTSVPTLVAKLAASQSTDLQQWRDNSGNTLLAVDNAGDILTGSGKFHEFLENGTTDAAAGAANTGRLYVRDNGSGKTQLCVRFNTGVVQVIATEP